MLVRSIRAASLAVLVLLLAAQVVSAHAELDDASPGPGDTITSVPEVLIATFTQDLVDSRSSIELRDAAGKVLATGKKTPSEPREMRLTLPALAPGEYTVRWTSFSAEDNELARGSYTFTVEAAPTPAPTPTPTPTPTPPPTPTPTPTASVRPSATAPTATATPTPTPTATVPPTASPAPTPPPTPVPSASPAPDPQPAAGGTDVLLPILAAVVVVAGLGLWTLRRRAR